jgi:hypothetical protein
MPLLVSVMGGVFMTVGALTGVLQLLRLTSAPAWPQLRAVARVSPATSPSTPRDARFWLCSSMFVTISGTLLLLNMQNEVAKWLVDAVLTVLVLGQLRLLFMSRRQRRPAG